MAPETLIALGGVAVALIAVTIQFFGYRHQRDYDENESLEGRVTKMAKELSHCLSKHEECKQDNVNLMKRLIQLEIKLDEREK